MGADSTRLVVRYRPEAREEFQVKVVPFMRRQATLTLVLGSMLALVTIGAIGLLVVLEDGLLIHQWILISVTMLALPASAIILAVRKLRRTYSLPEVVLTVTDEHVVLGPMERMTLFGPWRPELRWDRRTTEAKFITGNGVLTHERIKFTSRQTGKRRTQYLALPKLDASAEEILDAVNRP